jgi:low affinity Fe/Cu permease
MSGLRAMGHKAGVFDRIAGRATRATGSALTFLSAVVVILIWALLGPLFGFSETWQLVVNTATTIVTFLMVFLIQHSQNKDSIALHLKLNELIAAMPAASNRMIAVEDLDEHELRLVAHYYQRLAELARESGHLHRSHSLDGATRTHERHHPSAG